LIAPILRTGLDKWCEEEAAISTSFKERLLLEYVWYHITFCYADTASKNQTVSDTSGLALFEIISDSFVEIRN